MLLHFCVKMSATNLNQAQRLFGDLSLKNKPTINSAAVSASTAVATANNINNSQHNGSITSSSSSSVSNGGSHNAASDIHYYRSASAYKHSAPELHDLIRFQHAIMIKYQHTHDQHYKNIAESLKPQIEDKIRAFHSNHQ